MATGKRVRGVPQWLVSRRGGYGAMVHTNLYWTTELSKLDASEVRLLVQSPAGCGK